jgi:exosortase
MYRKQERLVRVPTNGACAGAGTPADAGAAPPAGRAPRGIRATDLPRWYWAGAALLTAGLAALLFWPTLVALVRAWNREADYSHGFLVPPIAALLLWLRRDTLPKTSLVPGWGGLALLAASFGLRYAGERLFLTPLAGWALVLWLAGACWLLAGRRIMLWALPGLLFLMFMIPLPFRFEQLMSWRLQSITTVVSTAILECLGQPAIAEGHTIYLGDHVLEIEQACSGLRMFMGISAVAFAFVVLSQRPWWEKAILVLAVAPVAMLSNAVRVVVTGLLLQFVSGEAAAKFSHDAAGWGMIVVAALLFGLLAAYLRKLIVPVDYETGRHVLRRSASRPA